MYNLMVAGAAGDGIETMAGVFEKILKRKGFYLFSMRDFMSRVRGGHNFAQIRFGAKPVSAHRDALDGLVIFNEESFLMHKNQLAGQAFVLCSTDINLEDAHVVKMDIKGLAAQSGNPKTIGTVCIGALLQLFGLGLGQVDEVLKENLPEKVLEANLKAVRFGYEAVQPKFTIEAGQAEKTLLLTGAAAMSMGAIAGGVQFYSAYPMSPSTTVLDFLTAQHETFRIGVEQAEDEIAAINMALGAAYTGARAMVGTSGGGFSLMVEALGFAGIAEIPIVIADIQRPGPATGLPTRTEQSDLQFVISASQGGFPRMVIAVRSHADAFYQTARAFYLAWKYQIPVILLSDQYLADSATTIPELDAGAASQYGAHPEWQTPQAEGEYLRYKLTDSGISPLQRPGESNTPVRADSDEHDESGVITEAADVRVAMVNKRAAKLQGLQQELQEPARYGPENAETVLLAFGSTEPAIAEAIALLNQEGSGVAALVFGDIYPLPQKHLLECAKTNPRFINVEQNATGQLAALVRQQTGIACAASVLKYDGRQISVDEIVQGVQANGKEKA